jgi:imidazolonepropionase
MDRRAERLNEMNHSVLVTNIGELITFEPLVRARRFHSVTKQDLGSLKNAWLLIKDGKVADYGTDTPPTVSKDIPSIDARGNLVMPGLIDSHSHPLFAGSRSHEFAMRLNGSTYQQIADAGGGIMSSVRATRDASDDDLTNLLKSRAEIQLRHGVTTIEVKSGYGLSIQEELRHLRIINQAAKHIAQHLEVTCLALHAWPKDEGSKESFVKRMTDELLPVVAAEKLARWVDAFVEKGYFEPSDCDAYFAKAQSLGLGIRIHADEFQESGAALASARWGAASADHLQCASDEGIAAMAKAGVVATILPGTSLYCKIPYTQASKFRQGQCPIALATDFNPGSCQLDNLPMLASVGAVHCGLSTAEAVAAVTLVAARSLRIEANKGALAKGFDADLIITSLPSIAHWIADFGRTRPMTVVIGGTIASSQE